LEPLGELNCAGGHLAQRGGWITVASARSNPGSARARVRRQVVGGAIAARVSSGRGRCAKSAPGAQRLPTKKCPAETLMQLVQSGFQVARCALCASGAQRLR
jgi:hypothetical protein